ncbi:ABC transporter permease [Tomitella biformata]|uniref:ABC transporter permease n=1 Tax=Tomitella biformata TaxID=630403 RepID=UPI000464B4B6|nr:FtsX-like permease family protein [Tomitella biformata]
MAPTNAMRRVSLRNLAAHKVRLALTVLSVVLGTAFVAGSFVFTDTLHSTFNGVFANTAKGVDVHVAEKVSGGSGVPLSDVDKIRELPNVRAVEPAIRGSVVLIAADGKPIQSGGAPSFGAAYSPPGTQLGDPTEFLEGGPPDAAGQIAINQGAATNGDLHVGSSTQVLVPASGMHDVTVSGVYSTSTDTGGFVGVLMEPAQAASLFTDGQHVQSIDIAATPGTSPETLRDEVSSALPNFDVKTGDQVRAETQEDLDTALQFVNYFLLAFGAIALLVGTFIIYNTFSMIVAQRLRELALLRAIGASRRQVSRSVLLEAAVVGLIGSLIGLAAGIALAFGLRNLLNAFDLGLPTGALDVQPSTVAISLSVGIIVTLFSAWAPARRASNTPPVAAMRAEFASVGTSLRTRTVVGSVIIAIGVAALIAGSLADTTSVAASLVGAGAAAVLIGVLLVSPALSSPAIRVLGYPAEKLGGTVSRLARTNAVRNPRRTAATGFALTLGLMLVTTIAVFGASARASVDTIVDNGITADYILTGTGPSGVPVSAAQPVAAAKGVAEVVQFHPASAQLDGETITGIAVTGPIADVLSFTMDSGTPDLTGDGMIASQSEAAARGWQLGSTVTLIGPDRNEVPNTITGIYADSPTLGNWIIGQESYAKLTPALLASDLFVLIKAQPRANLEELRGALTDATDPFVVVKVQDREQFKGEQAQQIDQLLAILYGLLALAVVIAILGIINTLALSVVERRQEIGMLRAIGMQRAQVRRLIYLESALIAVFGAVLGIAMGLAFGTLFVHALRDEGINQISIPWGQAIGMLVGSGVVGVLAALWPAVRAARTRPLEAIADE